MNKILFFSSSCLVVTLVCLLNWLYVVRPRDDRGQSAVIVTDAFAMRQVAHPELNALWNPTKKKSPPTNAWWTNLVLGNQTPAVVTPYAVRLRGGVEIGYGFSRRVETTKTVSDPFVPDLALSCSSRGDEKEAVLAAYYPLTATFDIPNCLRVYLARGSPYVTTEFYGDQGEIALSSESVGFVSIKGDENEEEDAACSSHDTCSGIIGNCCPTDADVFLDCCSGSAAKPTSGLKFSIVLADGTLWRLYSSSSIIVTPLSSRSATVTKRDGTPFVGVLRIAHASDRDGRDDDDDYDALDTYSGAYAIASDVNWAVRPGENTKYTLEFQWTVKGNGELIHLALPHHVASMVDGRIVRELEYTSLKGKLVAYRGSRWTMVEHLPQNVTSWFAPRSSTDPDHLKRLVEFDVASSLPQDVDERALAKAAGVYSSGKRAARFASLAIAAYAVGMRREAEKAAESARRAVAPWLDDSDSSSLLVYETTFGGVCTAAGLADRNADYGNGWYNDHHFHYGYLIYAAAVSSKILGDEDKQEDNVVLASLVADVVNPRSSSSFPPLARHKDFYDGHSWAAGLFEMYDGRSQESVSEAINCYYAVALYADTRNDGDLGDFARLLLALELRAAKTYWHVARKGKGVYPRAFSDKNVVVAVVGASDVSADTWFASGSAYAHGINILPVTPVTESLLQPLDYVAAAVDDAKSSLALLAKTKSDTELGPWRELYTQMLAVVDTDQAARHILELADQEAPVLLDPTQTLSSMMYWATTRPRHNTSFLLLSDDDDDDGNSSSIVSGKGDDDDDDSEDAPPPASSCAANQKCVNLGLTSGDCCPTSEGVELWCCASHNK